MILLLVIGPLQYLSLTRPDISYAVNKLSQFMHSPLQTHWAAKKRLLRYLKHTIHHGLFLHRQSPLIIHGFSYSDWAGNRDDRTSTAQPLSYILVKTQSLGAPRNSVLLLIPLLKPNIVL